MIELLDDIRRRLLAGEYKNEEHVRLSLVARIVQAVGWNIWSPGEVYTEFKATEKEDNTRVDMALFANNFAADTIFIECKGIGRIGDDLAKVERQLRDYNRNHSALFTIITDGQHWRFYFSLTSGEFNQKLFGRLDLLHDEPAETAAYFQEFLGRENILNGSARVAAENYLLLSRKERAMKDVLPEAEKRITQPPFPALPEALAALLAAKGLVVSREEATAFLAGEALPKPSVTVKVARNEAAVPLAVVAAVPTQTSAQPTFYLQLKRSGISATAQWSDAKRTKLVVKAGSTAALEARDSLSKGHRSLRQVLIQQNVLIHNGDNLIFAEDYSFESAGEAGDVICGYSVNGRTIWGDGKGKILGDY